MACEDDKPLPFSVLQRRIGRKTHRPGPRSKPPLHFLAVNALKANGEDLHHGHSRNGAES